MGLIKAFAGALGGSFADQWKDFFVPSPDATATCAVVPGVPNGRNAGRGSNTKGSSNIITNGSKIVVPDGYCMVLVQDGQISSIASEPGGFTFSSDEKDSQSVFSGGGISAVVSQSWERFKFGGRPGAEQLLFYVNLKEIPNIKFGTKNPIYWDDAYLASQAGARCRGTLTIKIEDPYLFLSKFVPVTYLRPSSGVFDLDDMDNAAGDQLHNEITQALSAAFSQYTNSGNRITKLQGDQAGFAKSLSEAINGEFAWRQDRGIAVVKAAIVSLDYDDDTKARYQQAAEADSMSVGNRANVFMQMSAAKGMQAAGENGGGMGMAMMGMGMGAAGQAMGGMMGQTGAQQEGVGAGALNFGQQSAQPQQPVQAQQPVQPGQPAQASKSPMDVLKDMKQMLDAGLITQEEYDAKKAEVLANM